MSVTQNDNTPGIMRLSVVILLAVAAVLLPWSWRLSLYSLFLLVPCAAALGILQYRTSRSEPRDKTSQIINLLLLALPAVYALSIIYSTDTQEAWRNVTAKLTLALFAIVAFCTPSRLLTNRQVASIMQFFTLSLAVRFVVRLGITLYDFLLRSRPHDELLGYYFDPNHHSYLSMYLLLALVYVSIMLYRARRPFSPRCLPATASAILMIAYIIILQSRAAILALLVLAAIAWLYIFFVRKRYKLALLMLLMVTICASVSLIALPGSQKRLLNTAKAVAAGRHDEDRYQITKATLAVIACNMPLGVGAGDRTAELIEQYAILGATKPLNHSYNPHNQYLDTLMTTGIIGLLIILAIFIIPFIWAVKRKNLLLAALIFIVAFNALFESLFERQMGLIFFPLFLLILQDAASLGKITNEIEQ